MTVFPTIELIAVVIAALLLLGGLSLLALRRRNEILQDYLTPKEHDIEQEFFKKRPVRETPVEEETAQEAEPSEEESRDDVAWGTPGQDPG